MKAHEQFQPVQLAVPDRSMTSERAAEMDKPLRQPGDVPLKNVRANIVQSIRAYHANDLQEAATERPYLLSEDTNTPPARDAGLGAGGNGRPPATAADAFAGLFN